MENAAWSVLLFSLFLAWSTDGHTPFKRQIPLGEGSASGDEPCMDYDVRLVGGGDVFGEVEVCSNGTWGTVCADAPFGSWTRNNAIITCRQLGLPTDSAVAVVYDNFGGPAAFSFLHCSDATKESFAECMDFSITYNHLLQNCSHAGGVICEGMAGEPCATGDVRLMDGSTPSTAAGRVEVCFEGIWGTVCNNNNWDGRDASIVCRKLGVNASYPIGVQSAEFGAANLTVPILLNNVECKGHEENIVTECAHNGVNVYQPCKHVQDAGVICQAVDPECNDTDLRFRPGNGGPSRVVQVCFSGVWGYVCADDGWDGNDATVACRQLGLNLSNTTSSISRPADGIIMLSLLNCTGSERRLSDCSHPRVNAFPSEECPKIARVRCETTGPPMEPDTNGGSSSVAAIAGALGSVAVVLLFLCIAIIGSVVLYRTLWIRRKSQFNIDSIERRSEQDYTEMETYTKFKRGSIDLYSEWREVLKNILLEQSQLVLSERLGEGCFGRVYRGTLRTEENGEQDVAVKTLKDTSTRENINEFVEESIVMLGFNHQNVLKLLGVCFDTEDGLPLIVLPFMANGDLKSYLMSKRGVGISINLLSYPEGFDNHIATKMCKDIACGMEYLASSSFVHRDLAARNCMVSGDMTVYIADFGLSRDVYSKEYYRLGQKTLLPVKWMAPESLNDNIFTEKTDVWSFGVVCWEVFSLGSAPYPTVDNHEIPDYIAGGRRLKKPKLCPPEVYQVMELCWKEDPSERPKFVKLAQMFEHMVSGHATQPPLYVNVDRNGIVE